MTRKMISATILSAVGRGVVADSHLQGGPMRPTRTAWTLDQHPAPPSRNRIGTLGTRLAVFVLAAVALLSLPLAGANAAAPAASEPPSTPLERVQALVQPAVVYEQITWTAFAYDVTNSDYFTDKPFTASFQCTGFVVNPTGYVATAGHCVEYSDRVAAALAKQVAKWAYDNGYYASSPSLETITTFANHWRMEGTGKNPKPDLSVQVAYGVSVSGEETGKALPARVVGIRPWGEGDVALLKVDAKNLTVLPLTNSETVGVGTQIVSVGYPASVDLVTDRTFDPSFKEGSISAEKTTKGGLFPVYEVSAAVSGGMSGGPTASLSGQAIGVNSFGIQGETQQFNFVQSSKTLEELMRAEGVANELGPVTDLYRTGLGAYFAGDRDAAIAAFDGVLEIVPTHEFAQKYRTKAKELPEQKKILGLPIAVALLIIVVILVIVALVVVLLVVLSKRRRNAGKPAATPPPPPPPFGPPGPQGPPAPSATLPPPPPPTTGPSAAGPAEGLAAHLDGGASAGGPTGGHEGEVPEAGPAPTAPPAPSAPEPPDVAPVAAGDEPGPIAPAPAPADDDAGRHAGEAEATKHYCAQCGAPHSEGAHFCEHCGAPLS